MIGAEKRKKTSSLKLFLLFVKRFLLATRAVFFYFHAVRMGFFVFGICVVFLVALGASQSELNAHS